MYDFLLAMSLTLEIILDLRLTVTMISLQTYCAFLQLHYSSLPHGEADLLFEHFI